MTNITIEQLRIFFKALGERCEQAAEIYIFGGSALLLIGGQRNTLDVDFTLTSQAKSAVRTVIATVADEFGLDTEESTPADFLPLPTGSERRHRFIGQYGHIKVFIFDPYSIALMKIDRAFESDIEDVRFLLQNHFIDFSQLASYLDEVAIRSGEPRRLRENFALLKS